ncbi:MAG: hypothetical protein HYS81_01690 [Candidatus Aenigmatarchaeota archaeon]|nr:MAG: hypothetical protein HYS81_01690 [Candidatus Aenigmarchaeota archaeon]
MNKLPLIAVFFVIFMAGCVGGFEGFKFGGSATTIEAPDDVLLITDAKVVPTPPIPADSTFDLTFLVENTGDAETGKEAKATKIYAFNWGRCEPAMGGKEGYGNANEWKNTTGEALIGIPNQETSGGRTIFPGGGAYLVEWTFRSPTNDELGRVQGICTVQYKVGYDFTALTVTDVNVVSEARLREANRAGETITVTPITSKSKGPLKIDIAIGADQPIREGTTVPIRVSVEDRGAGLTREVGKEALTITFPDAFIKIDCEKGGFKRAVAEKPVYTNAEAMPFIRKETPPLRCDVTMPSATDLRTYTINAQMDYRYELFDETDVSITPTIG